MSLPLAPAPEPDTFACLQCQLLGHRKLTCAKAEVCRSLPHVFALGPILLVGWVITAIAFVLAIR